MNKTILKNILQFSIRKLVRAQKLKLTPVSRSFGYDRGTPIDRIYIADFLKRNINCFKGDCLEIGYPEFLLKFNVPIDNINVIGVNDNKSPYKFINCDLTDGLSIPAKKFDLFVCTQTYNFIYDYVRAVENSARLLKDTGTLIGTVSGLSSVSSYDDSRWGDYYRFSTTCIKQVLGQFFNNVEVFSYGNFFSTIHYLAGYSYQDVLDKNLLMESDPLYPIIICFKASNPKIG